MDNQENEILEPVTGQPETEIQETMESTPAAEAADQPVTGDQTEPVSEEPRLADSPYVTVPEKTEPVSGYTMPPVDHAPKKSGRIWKRVVAAVLAMMLVGGSCAVTASVVDSNWQARADRMESEMGQITSSLERQLAALEKQLDALENDGESVSGTASPADGLTPGQVYARNVDSVVLVYSMVQNGMQAGYSTGSGFILNEEGYIVTNFHVVEGGHSFTVVNSDNEEYEARFVGGDSSNDIAVLKIEAEGLKAAALGSSDDLIVGDQVAAIGNPLGELTSTLTVGYVSAKGRYVTTDNNTIYMFQTDCAINSGNSGGPLFNMKGEVVGITTAKYSGTSNSGASIEGIGFAIPIDDVVDLIDDIIEYGYVHSAYLGVRVSNQNEITAGLPDGAYIESVEPGYCAERAGIQAGDYIIAVGEHEINTMNDLTRILRRLDPGTTTTITVLRDGREIVLEITLDERPNTTGTDTPAEQVPIPEEGNYDEWYEYFRWFFENQEQP